MFGLWCGRLNLPMLRDSYTGRRVCEAEDTVMCVKAYADE